MNIDELGRAATEGLRAVSRPLDPDAMIRELKRTRRTRAVGRVATAAVAAVATAVAWNGLHASQPPIRPVTPPIVSHSNGAIVFSGPGGVEAVHGAVPRLPADAVTQSELSWSPDGFTLAYEAADGRLALMNTESGQTHEVADCDGCDFAWSPAGNVIAITSGISLRLLDVETLESTEVPTGPLSPSQPTWAPDATRLAFASVAPGGRGELYAIDVDGSNATLLWQSAPPRGDATTLGPLDPAWAPDGRSIAFINSNLWAPVPKVAGWHLNVTTVAADGSAPAQRLIDIGTCTCFGFAPGLAWSPDGTALAVNALTHLGWGLHIVEADGSGLRFVDTHAHSPIGAEGPIAWQPLPQ
jgi:hypothetical protein